MREGGFCATLFRTARKSLILNGEMSEWSIEHAWKAWRELRRAISPDILQFPREFSPFRQDLSGPAPAAEGR